MITLLRAGHLSVPDAFPLVGAIPNPLRNSACQHWLRIRFPDASWRAKARKKKHGAEGTTNFCRSNRTVSYLFCS
jgi:hypothetical protein